MRRVVMALVTAGVIAGGLVGVSALPAAADETGSVRITSDTPKNREW
ncbi:hypothetical protein GCM10009678_80230 [Actinomadura kijaniata]|uniref:Uncharacterized protein n=1 Tax=Actinomadura namibiensis TaxID=182080 RepID=A0A7W3LYV6_ACTNM|nr:hypothetical protein [Actinomadura namibiensis]MBA8956769.1 hypothetical protein [Actinomadura namibiensis]